jgi:hypothetical protein
MLRSLAVLVSRSLTGRFVSGRSFPVLFVRAHSSRLMSTENPVPPTQFSKSFSAENLTLPTPPLKLNEQLSAGGILFTVVVALISTAAYFQGELKKLDERVTGTASKLEERMAGTAAVLKSDMAGTASKLEERIAGVIKEVDAKNYGSEKSVEAKNSGMEKSVDNKMAGLREAADLKYSSKSNKWW